MKNKVIALLLALVCQPMALKAQDRIARQSDALNIDLKTPTGCPQVLKACKVLVDDQDVLIRQLNANQKALEKNLEAQSAPLIPLWAWIGVSLVVGAVGGRLLLK